MSYNRKDSSPLSQKSYIFGVNTIKVVKAFSADWRFSTIFTQFLKSGTSIGANVSEAEYAQSPADFITKLTIALKEANETRYWINILRDSDCLPSDTCENMLKDVSELIALLISSIKTVKSSLS